MFDYYTHNENGKVGEMSAATVECRVPDPHGSTTISDPILNEKIPRGTASSLDVCLKETCYWYFIQ